MSNQRNIKAAPVALTPAKVEQLLHWAEQAADANGAMLSVDPRCSRPAVFMGFDLARKPDGSVEIEVRDGRVVSVKELRP